MKNNIVHWLLVLVLPLLQYAVFDRIDIGGYINPQFYVLLLVVFPFCKERLNMLVAAFLMGSFLDLLSYSGGVHAFALVFVAYYRIPLLSVITGKNKDEVLEMNWVTLPYKQLIVWVLMLDLLSNLLLFSMKNFSFYQLSYVMKKVIFTTFIDWILILSVLQFYRNK